MPIIRLLSTLVIAITLASSLHAQVTSLFDDAHIDGGTRWAFRTRSPVTVSSPIVRLGDIIEPMVPDQAGWQRLSGAAVGLVPISGEAMTIRRDRLNQLMLSVEATPRVIDWHGPTEIHVEYKKQVAPPAQPIQPVAYRAATTSPAASPAIAPEQGEPSTETIATDAMTKADIDRIVHWVEVAMKQFYPEVAAAYSIHVPVDQIAIQQLQSLFGVNNMIATTEIGEGPVHFSLVTRKVGGEVQAEIELHLTAYPKVVVPNRSLGRGQRITAADLELKPFPPDKIDPQSVVDIESLIGQEVRGNVRSGRPILNQDVGPPILIHRGDLIEVRVIGGGVNVSTNAKALGDGAESDLIEIETMNPRKRLVARVADHGTVEIITRAPLVR